jgi:hypothetical protein
VSLFDIEQDLNRLDGELRQLEAEYTMFFAGRLPKPPWETRARVDATLKQLDREPIKNTALRFRFTTIQSRYASFVDLWERGMRNREEGRTGPLSQPPDTRTSTQSNADRVMHVATARPRQNDQTLNALYESLSEARRQVGAPDIPFTRFSDVVKKEIERLRAAGKSGVTFRVAIKDGKAHLTARTGRNSGHAAAGAGKNEGDNGEGGKA